MGFEQLTKLFFKGIPHSTFSLITISSCNYLTYIEGLSIQGMSLKAEKRMGDDLTINHADFKRWTEIFKLIHPLGSVKTDYRGSKN